MSTYNVAHLPEVDAQLVRTGRCPWCVTVKLFDGLLTGDGEVDVCPECGDQFEFVSEGRSNG
jgi:uncharacterized protein (DUF983 family)